MDNQLCANGCGFYGLVENKNLCSKCYRDYVKQENINAESVMVTSMDKFDVGSIANGISLLSLQTSGDSVSDSFSNNDNNSSGSSINRCKTCRKKVGLTGFQCRCGDVFCGTHRYAEKHGCNWDFKKAGRDILAKQSPLCKGDKLEYRI